jgi:hypothetical protein
VKSRRIDATLDLAKLLERRAWSAPSNASDDLNPRGLPYWISVANTGVAAGIANAGFIGQTIRYTDGSTATTKAGIDASLAANSMWRNYAGVYTAVGDADFVKQMRKAFHATEFKSPITVEDLTKGGGENYRIYMGLDQLVAYEDATTQFSLGSNFGNDLAKFHGNTVFRRVPIIHTPSLNGASFSPVYGVNHSNFYPVVLDGDWMRESEPMKDVEQHNVQCIFVDGSYQFFSKNVRESGFVLSTAT